MFRADLTIDSLKDVTVLECHYVLDRNTDPTGRPAEDVRGGKVTIKIESSDDTTLFEWVINPYAQKDGEITFFKRNDPVAAKVLKFKEAYLVEYGEAFNSESRQPMVQSFTISARIIELGGGKFENKWTKS